MIKLISALNGYIALSDEEFNKLVDELNNNISIISDEEFDKLKDISKEILSPFRDVEHRICELLLNLNVDDNKTILRKEKKEILTKLSDFASFASQQKLMDTQKYVKMLKLCNILVTNERIKAYIDECFFEVCVKKRDKYFEDCYKEFQKGKKIKIKQNKIREILENMMKDISIKFANRDNSIIEIMWLSIITGPHEACTRYPDGILKPEDYKPGLGIVDAYIDIYKFIKEYIEKYKKEHSSQV